MESGAEPSSLDPCHSCFEGLNSYVYTIMFWDSLHIALTDEVSIVWYLSGQRLTRDR